ncbi:MAG TPA: hypothetical protein VFN20_15450 [Candidatus Acidoferrum sp.]|nr:hypothetical protein [Candidatus Acidoferrum sp.]
MDTGLFSEADRARLSERVLEWARSDSRVVAAALVGSLAFGEADRWSDLDLTFAAADDESISELLDDWTRKLAQDFDAAHLLDLQSGDTIFRVFLLPGCLQFDLSFTPASNFGANGPKFKLLFGSAVEKPHAPPPSAHELFGYAVHHVVRARSSIERGRYWQAEYWISAARNHALSLACRRRGLPAVYGRGFDALPADVRESFAEARVTSLAKDELFRALGLVIEGLLREAEEVQSLATKLEPQLRKLIVK